LRDDAFLEKDDRVNFDFFVKLIKRCLGLRQTKEQVRRIFDLFDEDHTGVISDHNLAKVARDLGLEGIPGEEFKKIVQKCSSNTTLGHITFEDFFIMITAKTQP